jgi:hypothetical protein
MDNSRRAKNREKCYAKVWFPEINAPGYLRDISSKGCRIELLQPQSWKTGDEMRVELIPDDIMKIGNVIGTIEIRWTKNEDFYWTVGSKFVSVKNNESLENYKQLLAYYQTFQGE